MGEDDEMLLSEVAADLNVSHVTVWRYVDDGRLKARKVGPIYLVKRADFETFKANRRGPGRPRNNPPAE